MHNALQCLVSCIQALLGDFLHFQQYDLLPNLAGRTDSLYLPSSSGKLEERADQSPMAQKLRAWQRELKSRLGNALKELEPESAGFTS